MRLFQRIRRPRPARPSATNTTPDPGGATLRGLWAEYTGGDPCGPSLALAASRRRP